MAGKTSKRVTCINGKTELRTKCVGYCTFPKHRGYLNPTIARQHNCLYSNRNGNTACTYFKTMKEQTQYENEAKALSKSEIAIKGKNIIQNICTVLKYSDIYLDRISLYRDFIKIEMFSDTYFDKIPKQILYAIQNGYKKKFIFENIGTSKILDEKTKDLRKSGSGIQFSFNGQKIPEAKSNYKFFPITP